MTARKAPGPLGYWADETVPDLSGLLTPHGIDASEFSAWLGPQLGAYRGDLTIREQVPTRSEQRDAARQLAKDLAAVRAHLLPGRIPPHVAAHLGLVLFKAGENSHELIDRMRNDLDTMEWAVQQVVRMMEQQPAKRGRKATAARDELLNRVIGRVRQPGMDAAQVRSLASRILEACRVETPESGDDETIKKAALRGRRGKK